MYKMQQEKKELLSCTEVGSLLGVSTARIYQLIETGLPHVNLKAPGGTNNRYAIPRKALERWIDEKNEEAIQNSSLR